MGIIGFDDFAIFRLRNTEKKKILRVCKKNPEIESPSHFLRIAIIKELRRFDERGKERGEESWKRKEG